MSDAEDLAREFSLLTPQDQALVLALVYRLRGADAPMSEYPRDVPFMDFEQ